MPTRLGYYTVAPEGIKAVTMVSIEVTDAATDTIVQWIVRTGHGAMRISATLRTQSWVGPTSGFEVPAYGYSVVDERGTYSWDAGTGLFLARHARSDGIATGFSRSSGDP